MDAFALHQLTAWRIERGISQEQLATAIETSRQTVDRYENGRMPKQPYLDRIVLVTGGKVTANAWLGAEAAEIANKPRRRRLALAG